MPREPPVTTISLLMSHLEDSAGRSRRPCAATERRTDAAAWGSQPAFRESGGRLGVGVRVRGVWNVPGAREGEDLYTRKRPCELGHDRREGRRALVALGEEGRPAEAPNPFEVEVELLRV